MDDEAADASVGDGRLIKTSLGAKLNADRSGVSFSGQVRIRMHSVHPDLL